MLGDLEKVRWVVFKSGFNITQSCDLKNALYDLNNDHSTKKTKWYLIDEKERQIFYLKKINKSRYITGDISESHELLKSDCKSINKFLFHCYAFDLKKRINTVIRIY